MQGTCDATREEYGIERKQTQMSSTRWLYCNFQYSPFKYEAPSAMGRFQLQYDPYKDGGPQTYGPQSMMHDDLMAQANNISIRNVTSIKFINLNYYCECSVITLYNITCYKPSCKISKKILHTLFIFNAIILNQYRLNLYTAWSYTLDPMQLRS